MHCREDRQKKRRFVSPSVASIRCERRKGFRRGQPMGKNGRWEPGRLPFASRACANECSQARCEALGEAGTLI